MARAGPDRPAPPPRLADRADALYLWTYVSSVVANAAFLVAGPALGAGW